MWRVDDGDDLTCAAAFQAPLRRALSGPDETKNAADCAAAF
jgi:hypothetical protein